MSERGDRLILGTRKGTVLLERARNGWRPLRTAHLGVPVAYSDHDARTGCLWSCLDHGHWGQKLQRSNDFGETWEEVAAPAYPEGEFIDKDDTKPATLRYLWVLAAGAADQPGRLYLGTEPGGLFTSDDNGDTWELNRPLWDQPTRKEQWFGGGRDTPGIHSICVDPRDSKRVFVGLSCAGVFETTDDGATWMIRNKGMNADFLSDPEAEVGYDPHFMVQSPARPETFWMQNHMGIFKSTDEARTWEPVSEPGQIPHFGFAVATDEQDDRTAWVVPAIADECRTSHDGALCVCRTADGGATWTALREGLPQEGSYDLILRHGLDLAGDRLVFGTTTGNAYLSEDRGDSWTCLGNNFPQIYSVRFA